MTRRRWIADTWDEPTTSGATATIEGDQATHLVRVLRAQPGMEYDIVTGDRVWQAEIMSVSEPIVTFRLLAELEAAETLDLTVLLSVFKFDRLEWAIEKLTELGVSKIQPVTSRRTEKHLAQAAVNRVERWRRIGLEAAKQSRRTTLPEITDPRPLKEVLLSKGDEPTPSSRFLLAENEKQHSLLTALEALPPAGRASLYLAIGPEGGWTTDEEALFTENAWKAVSLGSTILRAETAAIAAVAITAAWMNG